MEISVIGSGVIGQATGKGLERFGHSVVFCDQNKEVLKKLSAEDYAISDLPCSRAVTFICVPEASVETVVKRLIHNQPTKETLVVIRSTVLPWSTVRLATKYNIHISHNPEFLREAVAEYEFMNPARVVIGECCKKHGDILEQLYRPFYIPIVRTNSTTSEMIKLASNAYLATNISFWNEMDELCKKIDVNSHIVGKACALDPRISEYGSSLHGRSFGQKCLPKDVKALKTFMQQQGVDPNLLRAIEEINDRLK